MKLHFVILVVASVLAYSSLTSACTDKKWLEYKEKFNKSYENLEDDMFHFYTFCDNLKEIEEHNQYYELGEKTNKLEVNKVTDLTRAEQNRYYSTRGKVRGTRRPTTKQPESEEQDY